MTTEAMLYPARTLPNGLCLCVTCTRERWVDAAMRDAAVLALAEREVAKRLAASR